jgi:predicted phosphodiesterase
MRIAWVAGNNEREMFERRGSDPGSGGLWDRRATWVGGRLTPAARLEPMLAGVAEATVVCGHTHVQFDRVVVGRRLVNAGSVGMPYEDLPGARWCLLRAGVELRTTPYDVEAAAKRIRATELPDQEEFVEVVTQPPTAQEATREFEALAGGGE